jgi:hypothetical protein
MEILRILFLYEKDLCAGIVDMVIYGWGFMFVPLLFNRGSEFYYWYFLLVHLLFLGVLSME